MDDLETSANLFLGMFRDGTDFLEGARHVLLPAGYEETGSCYGIVGTPLQPLLIVDLLEESLASILRKEEAIVSYHHGETFLVPVL